MKIVISQTDEENHIKLGLKSSVPAQWFGWSSDVLKNREAYDWFRQLPYKDKGFLALWADAWLDAVYIFVFLVIGAFVVDMVAQGRYLKGQALRGTRKLSLRAYAREQRKQLGYGFKVYNPK